MYKFAFGVSLIISLLSLLGIPSTVSMLIHVGSVPIALVMVQVLSFVLSIVASCYLVVRLLNVWKQSSTLLPEEFVMARRGGYIVGSRINWIATISIALFFVVLAFAMAGVWGVGGGFSGVPLGFALGLYTLGVLCVEVSYFRWHRAGADNVV